MKIKYVGLKDEETAFSRDTGITWFPGSVHDVPDDKAKRMLQHPDVFAQAEGDEQPTDGTPSSNPSDLESLTLEQLHALANMRGVKVHHAAGAAKVIDALRAAAE